MGERLRTEDMATTSTAVATVSPIQEQEPVEHTVVEITLRPTKTQQRKRVVWTQDTVDNENMNKKKSKCCCIYEKPRKFDESDSESDDDECEHCFGHVEKKKERRAQQMVTEVVDGPTQEPTTTVSLHPKDPEPAPTPPDKQPSSS